MTNLYDAVRQLRPSWFRRPGRSGGDQDLLVYLDDQQVGNASALRRFETRSIHEVRYLRPTEAQVRYGQVNRGRAALLLQTAAP